MGTRVRACWALAVVLALQMRLTQAAIDCYGALVEVKVIASAGSALNVYGYPGVFGVPLNCTASHTAPLVWAGIACEPLDTAAVPGSVGLVARGNCSFSDKAWHLQRAGYGAMVLADTTDDCTFMFANRSSTIGLTISATSITHQAGEALKQLLEGEEATASLRQPPVGRVDWSSWALWLLATGCVLTAAWWAGRDQLASQYGGTASHKGQEKQQPQQEEGLHITSAGAVGFVVLSSAMLLLLFFFLSKWVALLLVILFAIGAWQSTTSLVSTWLASTCPPTWHAVYVPLPGIGATPALTLAAATLSGAVTLTWVLCRHAVWSWVLQDFLAICLMLLIMRQLLLPNLKVACILLPLAFVYDVWWVFLQPAVTGSESVMVEVATGGDSHEPLPMVMRVPHWPSLGTNPAFSILGFGDVVLPGLLAVFARRFDVLHGLSWAAGYCTPCVLGYAVGLGITYLALILSWFGDEGQPALLYLVPCTLGTVALLGWQRGQLTDLWHCDFEGREQQQQRPCTLAASESTGSLAAAEEQRGLLQT